MSGCQTCGGFGMRHDPIAHGTSGEPDATGEDWTDPTPEQIAACAAYDPDPEQYGTAGDDVTANDEPCMCGTPFTCMADDHDAAVVVGIARAEAVVTERVRIVTELRDFADDLYGITGARWIADALTSTLDRISERASP